MSEQIAYSPDAAQYLRVRADEDGCVIIEAVNRVTGTTVWLDSEGIDQLIAALSAMRDLPSDERGDNPD